MKKFLILSILILYHTANAEPLVIDDSLTNKNITRSIEYLEDKNGTMTLDEASAPALEWSQTKEKAFNFGFTPSVYWFKMTVVNKSKKDIPWFFEIDYPMLNYIRLFIPAEKGKFNIKETGNRHPFNERDVKNRTFIFSLNAKPGAWTYYMRIQTVSSMNFQVLAWSPSSYYDSVFYELPLYWIYYGLMMVMVIYNLLLFISIREKSYILYTVFIIGWILFQMTLNGLSFQYLWPNSIWWANNCLPFFMGFSTAMGALLPGNTCRLISITV